MVQSLWKIPNVKGLRTPVLVLREQADALTESTEGILMGRVDVANNNGNLSASLSIAVPALNGYTYQLIRYTQQSVTIFPGFMINSLNRVGVDIKTMENFENYLEIILASKETAELLESLLSQSNAVV